MGNKTGKTTTTELTQKQVTSLKVNTNYSEKQIEEWHQGFIRDSPSGRIDSEKFVEIYKEFYPAGKAEEHCKYAFDTFDQNNDGTIDFEEFLLAITATSPGSIDARLEVAFDLYDSSHDGHIDQKEFATLIAAIYNLGAGTDILDDQNPQKRAAEIMDRLDVSGDNKVSKQEFMYGCKNDPVIRQLLAPDDATLRKLARRKVTTKKTTRTSIQTTKLS